MSTVFEYLYRDASNYKAWGSLLLEGIASSSQLKELQALMDEGRYFIPQQVDVPPLQEQLYEYSRGPTEDDHVWHEFFALRDACLADVRNRKAWGTVKGLVSAFRRVHEWDPTTYAKQILMQE